MSIIVPNSVVLVVNMLLKGQLGANTHLLLSTDIADDGVGGRAGGGAKDRHHPFRHDLAH